MVGFDIRSGPNDVPGEAANALLRVALRQGLITYASSGGSGTEQGDHAMLLPPLTITSEQAEFMVQALESARSGAVLQRCSLHDARPTLEFIRRRRPGTRGRTKCPRYAGCPDDVRFDMQVVSEVLPFRVSGYMSWRI